MTLQTAINWLVLKHGGLRGAAEATGIDAGYLSRLASGKKINPSDKTLCALGLKRVVTYRRAP